MLRLEGALRDIQDASAGLTAMTTARDADACRRSFDACLHHLRGAHWKIQTAVKTVARQEPGRPRVDRAAAWWAAQADVLDTDPLLRWAFGAGADPRVVEAVVDGEARMVVPRPPDSHLGRVVPLARRTPEGLLALCIAHTGDLYDRALRAWG